MNKQLFSIVWIEGAIAFFIPSATTSGAAIAVWATAGSPVPNHWAILAMTLASLVAGLSGLKSFLSTTVSDAKDDLATKPNSVPVVQVNTPVDAAPPKV